MSFLRKFLFLSIIIALISYSVPQPFSAVSDDSNINEEVEYATIFIDDETDDTEAPLYETDSTDSPIVIELATNSEVIVIERGEEFSFVHYVEDSDAEESTILEGYIQNKHLLQVDVENEEAETDTTEATSENEEKKDPIKEEEPEENEVDADPATLEDNATKMEKEAIEKSPRSASVQASDLVINGIALKDETHVYAEQSRNSEQLRSYAQGTILQFRAFNSSWYIATVKVDGAWASGYIHQSDVDTITETQSPLQGVALKDPTKVYSKASTHSKELRSYAEGSVLIYRTLSSNWYEATVIINGTRKTGYIHKSDVENKVDNQQIVHGIGTKNPTYVYSRASTRANAHKSYAQGTVLKYKTFSKNWYEAIVYVKGKPQAGFIHRTDVEQVVDKQEVTEGWALKTPTHVYSRASKNSTILRNDYKKGQKLKLKTLSQNWFEVTVKYKGKWATGYIHTGDVSLVQAMSTNYDLSLKEAVDIQLKGQPQTDKKYAWVSKDFIKDNKVTATSLNVRLGPGTNFKSVGTIPENTTVEILDEYNGWYVIDYQHDSQWTHAGPKDVMNNLNPQRFINDERLRFQFLDLSKPSGASTSVLNNYLKGRGTLAGQGNAFIDAAKKHGLNDIYLISHATLETGHGTSALAQGLRVGIDKKNIPHLVTEKNEKELSEIKTVYNMFGVRAFDSCPNECGAIYAYEQGWDTPYKAIIGGAEFIGGEYILGNSSEGTVLNTLYKMRWNPEFAANNKRYGKQYATDVGWAVKQVNSMYNLYQEIGGYTLVLDIPVYR